MALTVKHDSYCTVNRPPPPGGFVVVLRPEAGCAEPIVALRRLLKTALRVHRLRCIGVTTQREEADG